MCKANVANFQAIIFCKGNVARFGISVQDSEFMEMMQAAANLYSTFTCFTPEKDSR